MPAWIRPDPSTSSIGTATDSAAVAAAPNRSESRYDRFHMPRRTSFSRVEAIGKTLPDVEVTTSWGAPALKVRGTMFVCIASHTSAEPGTLVVRMDIANRDALVEEDPDTYYLKEHYVGYPCVLVRLSRVHADALRDLVTGAYRYVSDRTAKKSQSRRKAAVGSRRAARRAGR